MEQLITNIDGIRVSEDINENYKIFSHKFVYKIISERNSLSDLVYANGHILFANFFKITGYRIKTLNTDIETNYEGKRTLNLDFIFEVYALIALS